MKKYIPYIVIAVLLVSLVASLTNRKEVVIKKTTSDTVTITIRDTIFDRVPVVKTEIIIDTIFIETNGDSIVELPLTQKYYSTNEYKAWVSGYKPNLDSIYTFEKTVTKTITNTKVLYKQSTDVFLDAGCNYIGKSFSPVLGASIKVKKGIVFGGSVGYHDKGVYYGLKIGYKLNK